MPKKYNDYLPGETRQAYVKRRAEGNIKTIPNFFWVSTRLGNDGFTTRVNGTLAGPETKEYKRFLVYPQYHDHIKTIDKYYEMAKNN